MPRYSLDPRWLTAKYAGTCAKCGEQFERGANIFYYPNGKKAYSGECADDASRDFEAIAFDDAFMSG